MNERWSIIANPTAGKGRARRIAERAAAHLAAHDRPAELRLTRKAGHAAQLAREAVDAGATHLVACGGDGTVRELLPALSGSEAILGLLPFGTANDLARALGIPRHPERAIANLLTGPVRRIDLGAVDGHPFCTVATCGFDSAVSHAMSTGALPFSGTPGYLWAVLTMISNYAPPPVVLRGDFGTCEGRLLLVATGNTASYGGGMRIVPRADPTDGQFDLCIVDRVSTATVLRILPRIFRGGHVEHPAVRSERTSWLEIETAESQLIYADGDFAGKTPARYSVLPGALRILLPSASPWA